ncbi:MAG: hypothetical protein AB7Q42_08055 [Acidimicrobiia bacterium]
MKFYYFHHHHYSHIPDDADQVDVAEREHQVYRRHMRTVRLADQLGFDGITRAIRAFANSVAPV